MGTVIRLVLENVPAILLVASLVAPMMLWGRGLTAERWLGWVLLVGIGLPMLWAAFYHLALPDVAARLIGWAPSPFQFEVGIADLAMGFVACLAIRQARPFKAAVTLVLAVALLGDAGGHVIQMVTAGNEAPGNAGSIFYWDIAAPLIALGLLARAQRDGVGKASRGMDRSLP